MESRTFLTVPEVAPILRKSKKWIYDHKYEIPGFFQLAGSILFDREILFDSLKKKAAKPPKKVNQVITDDRHGVL